MRTKILLGGLAAFGIAASPPAGAPVQPASAIVTAPAPQIARDPLGVLLTEGQTAAAKLRDYACTFTKQERINGVMSAEQVAEMKVRVQPFSIAVRYVSPSSVAGQQMLVSPRADGRMRYRPAGSLSTTPYRLTLVDDSKVMATNRRPVTKLSMGSMMEMLNTAISREKSLNNPVEVLTSDYEFAGRPVTKFDVSMRRPHALRAFYRAVVFLDKETKLPVRFEFYDQPRNGGGTTGELVEAYSYSDIRMNVGLGDTSFTE